ncbi:MAG TPA: YiiD C-terminal domain-containing protein [Mariprofundaceae bacterium]|nr:YiiD C-terminal domain-containing protein [Mariprofundaceae bacterium]
MSNDLSAMQTYLHEHIPITAHFGVEVIAFGKGSICLRAPLAANINHRDTAFGGSLSSLGILAGWGLIHFSLQQLGLPSRIVIQSSRMEFLAPGDADFEATAALPDAAGWERFCTMLRKKGRARITLPSEVTIGSTTVASHEGVYVAILNDRLAG